MCAEMEVIMGKEKSIGKREFYEIKFLKRLMMFGVVAAAAVTIFMQTDNASAAKKKTKQTQEYVSMSLKKGVLTVKGKGEMGDPIETTAYEEKIIKKVVVKKGVISLPKNAFQGCKELKKVILPNTLKKIGTRAFANSGVEEINIPKSVQSIGAEAFLNTKIKSITLPKTLKELGVYVFYGCKKLDNITMPGKIKNIERIYSECEDDYLPSAFFGGTSHSLKKVKFTTVVDFDIVGRVAQSQNFQVAANDPKYKSVDGMIYTKNGRTLVGIPYGRKKIAISDKCTAVSTKSYWYGIETQWKWGEIIFPNTITKVIDEWNGEFFDYGYTDDTHAGNKKEIKVILNMKYLDRDSIKNLWQSNSRWRNSLKDELIRKGLAKLNEENERMLMLEDGYLCSYLVKDGVDINNYKTWEIVSRLVIPDNVKTIGSGAFTQCYVRSLILGSGVMYIEDNSIQAEPDEEPEAYTGSTKIYVKRPDISISDNAFINGDKVKVIIEQ